LFCRGLVFTERSITGMKS